MKSSEREQKRIKNVSTAFECFKEKKQKKNGVSYQTGLRCKISVTNTFCFAFICFYELVAAKKADYVYCRSCNCWFREGNLLHIPQLMHSAQKHCLNTILHRIHFSSATITALTVKSCSPNRASISQKSIFKQTSVADEEKSFPRSREATKGKIPLKHKPHVVTVSFIFCSIRFSHVYARTCVVRNKNQLRW